MSNDDITLERMTIDDRDGVLSYLRAAFADAPRQSDLQFWNWHYLQNPNCERGEIPVWLAKSNGRIVGQLATIPVELNIGDKSVPAAWILDLMVDPDFRRRGIMKRLVTECNMKYEYLLATATRRQHSIDMFAGLGWSVFAKVPRFHKLLFPGNAFKQIGRIAPLRAVVNSIFTAMRPSAGLLAQQGRNVRPLASFDESFDELWNECRTQWPCSISRTSQYLSWQFMEQPGKRYEILGYFDNEKLLGYAVLFFRKSSADGLIEKAAISDICYHPSRPVEIIDGLIAAALNRAVEGKAGGLVTDAIDGLLDERLRKFGFWPVTSGLELMAFGPGEHELLYDANRWFLTRADSDISIFEHPNQ